MNLLAAVVGVGVMLTVATAEAASPAETVVRDAIDSMQALPATEGHPESRRKLLDSIDKALALDLLAKQALGPQWAKLSEAERRHFIAIFTESLEKLAYPRAAAALSGVKVSYVGNETTASVDMVRATIAKDDGGKLPVDFTVAQRGARRQIVDVTLDGDSLSKAVASRIQQALDKEGYRKLVDEMEKRIETPSSGH
jgi:ABC-type transporter MlaC component